MAFHEVLFPPNISYGSQGGPKFKTTVFTADSGYEQRNIDWSMTRAEYAEGSPASGRDRAVLDCIGDEVRRFALQPAEAMPTTAMLRLRVDHVTR